MAFILNIETSSKICSVALAENHNLIVLKEETDINSHATKLTPLIDRLLKEANLNLSQIDAIAISSGPGSYTGLRIGLSTAKGICFALNKPLISVSTLRALASEVKANENQLLAPMIDARKNEVYAAIYNSKLETIFKPQPINFDSTEHYTEIINQKNLIITGNGASKATQFLKHVASIVEKETCVSAKNLIEISALKYQHNQFENLAYYEPEYLKNNYLSKQS